MKTTRILSLCIAGALMAVAGIGCGNSTALNITVFTAAPATISVGNSATLVFAATGSTAMTLSIDNGIGDVTGKNQVAVTPSATTTYTLTATDGSKSATATTTVTVGPQAAGSISLSAPATAVSGTAITVTATVKDATGKTATSYTGTVQLTSSDSHAVLPASYAFTAADKGVHAFSVTLKTSGAQSISAQDKNAANVVGTTLVTVASAPATSCAVTGLPTTTPAGGVLGARVTVSDANNNVATGYTGTITVTSSDTAAVLPSPTAFGAADFGTRVLPVTLKTAGSQTVTFADATNNLTCSATVAVTPSSAILVVTLPKAANAGTAAVGTVAVFDNFGNAITTYAGTVHFVSSDSAAVLPADIVFTAAQNGTAPISVTFNTRGSQTVTASDQSGSAPGTAIVQVQGFTYTNPPVTTGRVQLQLNLAASSASVVQLDLVSNTSLAPSQNASGQLRGGAYAAGMNLPVDITRAVADATPIVVPTLANGGVLDVGQAPQAIGGALPTTGATGGVFYSAVSQKASGAGANPNDAALATGQVFYSLRLKLVPAAAAGVVFDGNNLSKQFRAAVRSISGTDVIQQPDFAIGLLQVQ
jgi:hypothetical protein